MNILPIGCWLFILAVPIWSEQTLNYESITAKKTTSTQWNVTEKEKKLEIKGISSDKSYSTLVTQLNYTLDSFEQKDPNKGYDLKANREGKVLTVTGLVKKVNQTKQYQIGTTPWVQEFAFGFKDFLSSNNREYKFEILQPQTLDMFDMIATKENIEELRIDSNVYEAQKMKITLQGFRKRFWKAEAWYDIKTHRLLRYKANEGPGTPITDTILLENNVK